MPSVEPIADPYREAREAMNAAFESIVVATNALRQRELTPAQKRELASIVSSAIQDLQQETQQLNNR